MTCRSLRGVVEDVVGGAVRGPGVGVGGAIRRSRRRRRLLMRRRGRRMRGSPGRIIGVEGGEVGIGGVSILMLGREGWGGEG